MRNIVTISMSPSTKKSVDSIIKENNFASVSEFFRDTIRAWKEDKFIKDIIQSEKEFALGRGKRLKSLKDLM